MNEDDAMRFDKDAYAIAQQRVKSAPLDLTEADFDQLGIISKGLEAEGREAQRHAQLAIVAKAAAPLVTKGVEPAAPADDMKAFLQKHGKKPATYDALDKVGDALIAVMAKAFKERVVPLEQANKELSARVLELEAAAAAKVNV